MSCAGLHWFNALLKLLERESRGRESLLTALGASSLCDSFWSNLCERRVSCPLPASCEGTGPPPRGGGVCVCVREREWVSECVCVCVRERERSPKVRGRESMGRRVSFHSPAPVPAHTHPGHAHTLTQACGRAAIVDCRRKCVLCGWVWLNCEWWISRSRRENLYRQELLEWQTAQKHWNLQSDQNVWGKKFSLSSSLS